MAIYVQIASYRDPQLLPTIRSAIDNAAKPEELTFGICWQHHPDDPWDSMAGFAGDPRFRIIDVDSRESRGACWARAEIQKRWVDEEYTLQIDSHHRFAPGWDAALIDMVRRAPSAKPIITAYATSFEIGTEIRGSALWAMEPNFRHQRTIATFHPETRTDRALRPHMFWSGHFMFTRGSFCAEVRYDPALYFIGEEISMAVRSWTRGYDMFLPDRNVLWHEYTREGRAKHWGDHTVQNNAEVPFHERDAISKQRVIELLTGHPLGAFGLGAERSLEEYENHAGISFKNSFVSPEVGVSSSLPVHASSDWKVVKNIRYTFRLDWSEKLKVLEKWKPDGLAIFVKDACDEEIIRRDLRCDPRIQTRLKLTADSTVPPKKLVVWCQQFDPFKWGRKLELPIGDYDQARL